MFTVIAFIRTLVRGQPCVAWSQAILETPAVAGSSHSYSAINSSFLHSAWEADRGPGIWTMPPVLEDLAEFLDPGFGLVQLWLFCSLGNKPENASTLSVSFYVDFQ